MASPQPLLYVNIARVAVSGADRVFVLIGAGRRCLLHQCLRGAGGYDVVEVEA